MKAQSKTNVPKQHISVVTTFKKPFKNEISLNVNRIMSNIINRDINT